MESKVKFAVVGLFVLILGALLIGGVLWLSGGKSYGKSYDTYLVYMSESVSGLSQDAPVRYRGVQVGRVRHISLAPDNVELVKLTLDIERGTPVKQDTVAVLQVQGLTGIAHVDLSGGSRDSPPLKPWPDEEYPVIRTGPSLMLRLDNAVTALLTNLNRSSENINALLDQENRTALRHTLANLERLSGALAGAELPQLLQRLQRSADAFDRMANEAARAGASTADTADSVRAEALPEARQAIAELRELTSSLRRFSEALERNPGMLLQGRENVKPGPGE
ncbi:ABC transporter substrate-binding protein [Ferrigenium kumadai]|uniref:ABC transporter substrate-binding protein n=1 Tax=Ferrigenium kumadai TaxID=1682490 RepID=A0AAN1VZJ2_9PROT|nr:MlaD family protein [Ferrigenium kumadai]BBI99484.1 ABC transporter substrate-binding protein [Ferrigenium kumadai]